MKYFQLSTTPFMFLNDPFWESLLSSIKLNCPYPKILPNPQLKYKRQKPKPQSIVDCTQTTILDPFFIQAKILDQNQL